MAKKCLTLICSLALVVLCLGTAAQAVVVTPGDAAVPVSPAFGSPVAGGIVTNQYNSFGLMFGPDTAAVFDDPPLAWAGVNAGNVIDLLSPVSGFFVLPNTTTPALTSFVSVEVGILEIAGPTGAILEVFDFNGNLLASSFADDGIGPHGRDLATIFANGIHSFKVSTAPGSNDTWGMDQIAFCGDLTPVPVPPALLLFGSGLLGLVGLKLRRG
jgi:hypothetical protein